MKFGMDSAMVRAKDIRFGDRILIAGEFKRVIKIDQDYFRGRSRFRFLLDGDQASPYFMGACMVVKSLEKDLPLQKDAATVTPIDMQMDEHPVN